jgi:hypothetical protein
VVEPAAKGTQAFRVTATSSIRQGRSREGGAGGLQPAQEGVFVLEGKRSHLLLERRQGVGWRSHQSYVTVALILVSIALHKISQQS